MKALKHKKTVDVINKKIDDLLFSGKSFFFIKLRYRLLSKRRAKAFNKWYVKNI